MKIFILSDPKSIHTKRWISALAQQKINILLFGLNDADITFYATYKNVEVYAIDMISNLRKRHNDGAFEKWKYLKLLNLLKRKIAEFKPDILHAHYASSYGLLGALSGFHPYIISVWGSDVYDFPQKNLLMRYLLKFSLNKADQILSTSNIMAKETLKYTSKDIKITPFGVNTNLFRKVDTQQDSNLFLIGNVKTLSYKYGIDILIKAFALIKRNNPERNIKLEIIGGGPDRDLLIKLSEDLGLKESVEFVGIVENSILPQYYNRFSVAVYLSILNSESFGVAAVEAMACECPVVVSDADGFTEVVRDGETGIIVPKKDVESTAKAIQEFIDNPDLRTIMGKKGRERVMELYDWENNVNKMLQIYTDIIK
jgi:glycosyltransferase involved in cell wall biosynthesis